MDCETIRDRHIADEYRAGRLSPEEAEAYEEHYFSCDRCFEDLRFRDEVARRLREEGESLFVDEIAAERVPCRAEWMERPVRTAGRSWWFLPLRPAWAAGLLAVVALVIVVFITGRVDDRGADLAARWTPSAHPYVASELRAGAEGEPFRRGMELYQAARYREAAEWLERALQLTPSDAEIHFYLGVTHLMAGDSRKAIGSLETATDLAPSSALFRWYLAQARLQAGDIVSAEQALERVVEMAGDSVPEARTLLQQIRDARSE
jgi:tetratricopeptide (TPR) repeat protein